MAAGHRTRRAENRPSCDTCDRKASPVRYANLNGRFSILTASGAVDAHDASGGRFGPDPLAVLDRWTDFLAWAERADLDGGQPVDEAKLGPPVPRPRQVFAVGLNYRSHTDEFDNPTPELPAVFTKFPGSITGPDTVVDLPPGGNADWEVELVVVIGVLARNVAAADAWSHVAGLTIGQDISERRRQMVGPIAQFSLGKSYEGFGPTGPYLVTPDEVDDPDDLALSCSLNGQEMQSGRTGQLIFDVPFLIEHLSGILPLYPGDLIFTGTPAGVGAGRTPPVFIQPGDVLVSTIEGLGQIRQEFRGA